MKPRSHDEQGHEQERELEPERGYVQVPVQRQVQGHGQVRRRGQGYEQLHAQRCIGAGTHSDTGHAGFAAQVRRSRRVASAHTVLTLVLAMTIGAASATAYALGNDAVLNTPIDSATTRAFEMQRSGTNAGQPLTMSGDQASAAYTRYLKSFNTQIPGFFGSSLKSDVGSSGGSEGSQ